jgi:hypothetical protein
LCEYPCRAAEEATCAYLTNISQPLRLVLAICASAYARQKFIDNF